jgi:hypothetical protein
MWYLYIECVLSDFASLIGGTRQSQQLAVGLKSEGMLPWEKPSPVYVTIRQPGFVV